MLGFLNLDKPAGFTSHDCVAKTRKLLRLKRVGHGGTLDPMATGVLPIALGKATRLLQFLPDDKAYQATVRLGVTTTTDDMEGEVVAEIPGDRLSLEQVKTALDSFRGTIEQVPPIYSAIRVGGKRLYELARAGETAEIPARTVEVRDIEILDWRAGTFPELDLAIACSGGTYIRAIARDLGNALGIGGTLAALRRTASSGFTQATSLTFAQLEAQVLENTFAPLSPEIGLAHLPAIALPADCIKPWQQGQAIDLSEIATSQDLGMESIKEGDRYTQVSTQGTFLGIGRLQERGGEARGEDGESLGGEITSPPKLWLAPKVVF